MPDAFSGNRTFLFTDIEGSTKLWEQDSAAMSVALARHDEILRRAIESNDGRVFKTVGDAFCAAFGDPCEGVAAALTAQRALMAETWLTPTAINVRMAVHTGAAEIRDGDYFGQTLNRIARLLAIGHGKQVLLSEAASIAIQGALPPEASLIDRGHHRLKDLQQPENVFQLCHPALPEQLPPLRSLSTHPNNLPQQLTSFIGRENDIDGVRASFSRSRLITLSGAGGCGKSRLALQVAAELLEAYPDGIWLVELAALGDPVLVPQAVATIVGVKEQPGKRLAQTLAETFKEKQLLLVLDNAEHLLEAGAGLAQELLQHCPRLVVLVTSREPMGIEGELTYRVPALTLPHSKREITPLALESYESTRLFVERVRLHRPQFEVTVRSATAIASVCARLDGIPLAIELAAACVRSMSVEEVNAGLDQRFRLLTRGSRAAIPHHKTLGALIDWSYDLLSDAEKQLLCRLSAFSGGWTLTALDQVCAPDLPADCQVLDLNASLVDKSLVGVEERDGKTRYRMLETIRQYAQARVERAGDESRWRARHLAYFLASAVEAETQINGPEQRACLENLEVEHDNLRSALAWSRASDPVAGLRLAGALWRFWIVRGFLEEGRRWFSVLIAAAPVGAHRGVRAHALNGAGLLAWQQGDYAAAQTLHEQCLALQKEIDNRGGIGSSLSNLGLLAYEQGDYQAARRLFEEALALHRELGLRSSVAISLGNLANVLADEGDNAGAQALYEEALGIHRELDDGHGVAIALFNFGEMAYDLGDHEVARARYRESLAIFDELGDRHGLATVLEGLSVFAPASGTACIRGAAERLREEIGSPVPPGERDRHERQIALLRSRLSGSELDAAWRQGRAMTLEQAVEYALTTSKP